MEPVPYIMGGLCQSVILCLGVSLVVKQLQALARPTGIILELGQKHNISKHVYKLAGRLVGFIVKILYYKGTLGGWWGNHPVVKRV